MGREGAPHAHALTCGAEGARQRSTGRYLYRSSTASIDTDTTHTHRDTQTPSLAAPLIQHSPTSTPPPSYTHALMHMCVHMPLCTARIPAHHEQRHQHPHTAEGKIERTTLSTPAPPLYHTLPTRVWVFFLIRTYHLSLLFGYSYAHTRGEGRERGGKLAGCFRPGNGLGSATRHCPPLSIAPLSLSPCAPSWLCDALSDPYHPHAGSAAPACPHPFHRPRPRH